MAALHRSQERLDLSKIENRAPVGAKLFRDRIAATPNTEAFRVPRKGLGQRHVAPAQRPGGSPAAGLIALGINPEDRVALASGTAVDWVVADFAIPAAGAATTTVYPTTNAEDVAYIVANSGSRLVIAEDKYPGRQTANIATTFPPWRRSS